MTLDPAPTVAEPAWLDPDEARAWRGYLLMTRLLFTELGRSLSRDSGLSHADYEVLVNLSEAPDHRLRIHQLAAGLLWEKSRLSHQLTRMQQRGLVEREGCTSDARGFFVVLTEAGLAAIEAAAPAHVADVRRHFFDLLSEKQKQELVAISDAVLAQFTDRESVRLAEGDDACAEVSGG